MGENPIASNDQLAELADVKARLSKVEQTQANSDAINGPRFDQPSGWGVRVRWGQLPSGAYGFEAYDENGVAFPIGKTVGEMFFVSANTLPGASLWCDGTTYSYDNYPELGGYYGASSGGTFQVPNASGRVLVGLGGAFGSMLAQTGADTVTIATSNLPMSAIASALSLSPNPHSHTLTGYLQTTDAIASAGEASRNYPSGSGVGAVGTSSQSLSVTASGTAGALSVRQQSLTVRVAVFAGR